MLIKIHHPWDLSYSNAIQLQHDLASQVIVQDQCNTINYIAGVDVAYDKKQNKHSAAVVILDAQTLAILETATATIPTRMPYIPGLLSFREIPAIVAALEKLTIKPDLIICDGQGIAHPRGLGIASHLGVICDIPTIGCGKSKLVGTYQEPSPMRGSREPLMYKNEMIGYVLRTKNKCKPLFISPGHRVSFDTACAWVLKTATRYRVPEPIYYADHLAAEAKKR